MYRRIYDQHFASLWMATNADFAQHSLAAHFHEQCDVRGRRTNRSDGRAPDVYKHTLERLDPLSGEIYAFQKTIEQTPKSLCEKLYLRDLLFNAIHPKYPGSGLYVVGSTLNGFGSSASDMDLCLMITNQELDQRVDAIIHLTHVMGILRDHSWVKDLDVIFAKVPILRATFHAPFENIVVDLNANNSVAIRNTHLLAYYSGYDWRVRPLVCAVKAWAKQRGINNASQSSLTSYSLVLMEHYKEQFSPTRDIRQLEAGDRTPKGELLIGFFEYYAKTFDFDHQAISVRRGRAVRRADVSRCSRPTPPHAVYDERVFQCIKKSFEDASNTLKTKKTLEALLNVEPIDMLSGL
ncbi:hypothetical protein M3Y99_00960400 [Aphelenchoides fujianensis]|nr:hypothetical protein M3Y99_00960400 [Aphelenchoides fujianensis]